MAHFQPLHHGLETLRASINSASIHRHGHVDGFFHELLELTVDALKALRVCPDTNIVGAQVTRGSSISQTQPPYTLEDYSILSARASVHAPPLT